MKRSIIAAVAALTAVSAPAFADQFKDNRGPQAEQVQQQVTRDAARGANGFLVTNERDSAHSPRVQRIFDEIRAEEGPGTTD